MKKKAVSNNLTALTPRHVFSVSALVYSDVLFNNKTKLFLRDLNFLYKYINDITRDNRKENNFIDELYNIDKAIKSISLSNMADTDHKR